MSPYISRVEEFKSRRIQIGPIARTILRYYITETPLSAWDVRKKMKNTGLYSSYKNVHTKIQRLLSLRLISRENYKSKRGEIKYRLTSEGIFHLLLNSTFIFGDDVKGFFTNYGDDEFFRQFIYPYLSKDTILNISDDVFFMSLSMDMRDICYQLKATADYDEESRRPNKHITPEPPLKQVALFPLGLSIIYSCKYLGEDDLRLFSRDVIFMKELSKRLNQLDSLRTRLSHFRRAV